MSVGTRLVLASKACAAELLPCMMCGMRQVIVLYKKRASMTCDVSHALSNNDIAIVCIMWFSLSVTPFVVSSLESEL